MITIFTNPISIESLKAKEWLDESDIPYVEREYFDELVTLDEIKQMMTLTELGAEDLIAPEYLSLVKGTVANETVSLSELIDFIQEEPRLLKNPIIFDDKRLMTGFNEDEIQKFIPKEILSIEELDYFTEE
ncbi:spx/MgsR family transcriptional regulator [Dolosigranulum pigrum]|jgi:regulatory protein spx|uniref:Spx/MgsR family transcriptional regulator n=3 Tax=Dolosigranulum TaxID=29393 RepID=H3NFV9_9LACT|nr:ArsC/Spx/MgsR family protein [Dolosigranulum pigrum]DAX48053.1 MAG TPA: transcriptional regulator Spx [Caudoviricetes sp.]EHR32176.1 spx/MgsR family transcriptional regulator [Dolosigranulum pigrum ATCC 51524]QDO91828.1 spx/MgsR family transcriptional regulator [Dolosigranulum pigrum]QJS96071.1 spx/MgsR family transcriptional regulator [Dolosigranulum pigrum]QJS98668.1 spx/MgsR family transcriptional regulator [Dolosigranulum pigrum]